jgi:UDP:flavonoid glycosyltransferase YjiC (YdhE family)
MLLPSAPHDAVMKEVSIVVTHGGHGTASRALWHGLPLLVIPMGRDQNAPVTGSLRKSTAARFS